MQSKHFGLLKIARLIDVVADLQATQHFFDLANVQDKLITKFGFTEYFCLSFDQYCSP